MAGTRYSAKASVAYKKSVEPSQWNPARLGGRTASKSLYCLSIRIVTVPILELHGSARLGMLAFRSRCCESIW